MHRFSLFRRSAFALAVGFVAFGTQSLWAQGDGAAQVPREDVHVQRHGEAFSIDAVIHAPVPQSIAWDVVTDFDQMARYQSSLKESKVVERSPRRLLVKQAGAAHFGPFTSHFDSVREITLTPQTTVRARQISGSQIKTMSSLMTLKPDAGGGTLLTYHADIEPENALPPLVGPSAVQSQTAEQFSGMLQEMLRRQQGAGKN